MNNVTADLQSKVKSIITSLQSTKSEAIDLHKQYFDTDAVLLVGALAWDAAATVASKLKSQNYLAGITLCENLKNFFSNSAVTTADYLGTSHLLLTGNTPASSALSVSVEDIGSRMKVLAANLVEINKQAIAALSVYTSNQIDVAAATLDADRVVFGSDMTKAELLVGMTLVEQFKKLMGNVAVTTGDYASSLSKWNRLS